ncbi:unnamed protein product [Prorocentrum cordatum]|uniref:Subtilisin n=1 Tax=Prorocentrum cordatum TaxID=2364126 RepID=A0ABN9SRR2_9DINO|nr:unnamed protein product [Polarella glacialis]
MGVIAGTAELSGADDSLKTGRATAEDYLCDVAQMALQKIVEGGCGVAEVSCVYKMEGACDDWCTPSTQCGYIQDNPFMKFHDFSCSGRVSSDYVGYTVQCHPEFTVLGVLALVAVAVSALACCGGCFQFCRRRSRRRRGDY